MEKPNDSIMNPSHVFSRDQFIRMIDAALQGGAHRFARQASLAWLAIYPGDLGVSLRLAKSLLMDGKNAQAFLIFEKVLAADPEYIEAYEDYLPLVDGSDAAKKEMVYGTYSVLKFSQSNIISTNTWVDELRAVKNLIKNQKFGDAEIRSRQVLESNPECVYAAILHLKAIHERKDILSLYRYAERYHQKWSDCILISLLLAEARIEMGFEPEAVELLHSCVANDACGQVARRLWGDQHPYRPMWPESLEFTFNQPVPVEVAARLGWNLLPQGEISITSQTSKGVDPAVLHEAKREDAENELVEKQGATSKEPEKRIDINGGDGQNAQNIAREENDKTINASNVSSEPENREKNKSHDPIKAITDEFEKIAKRLKKPAISRTDGRFPVYVIFSSRIGLEALYGPQTTSVIIEELKLFVSAVRDRPGMGSMLYLPDDKELMKLLGLSPVESNDPWKLKLSLTDLDQALAKKGEMIGALLIIGGPEVVPFHMLPNPIDDMDKEVPSDNPYATNDTNYFIPEWPVGRIPGEKGPDSGFLLDQIRRLTKSYSKKSKSKAGQLVAATSIIDMLLEFLRFLRRTRKVNSLGYTAQVWQNSSKAVYKTIGDPNLLECSPPETSDTIDKKKIFLSQLGYYNLHGLVDAGEWYGQRDPAKISDGPDYPVALSPKDIKKNGHSPQVIFTEACYGGHIQNKAIDEALSLKFLALGTSVFVGSTCIAYGSVDMPLIAADLLGNAFWTHLREGQTSGFALLNAKHDLVKEMNRRQGYLDAEDQKTLISFILLGDPMAVYEEKTNGAKLYGRFKNQSQVKMICDQELIPGDPQPVSGEVLDQIKGIVETYLPGIKDGETSFALQKFSNGSLAAHQKEDSQLAHRGSGQSSQRIVISLRKTVQGSRHIHYHHARVTLDSRGKMVKLTMSR